jgi:membrane protease YdiL (CAAX protease family)
VASLVVGVVWGLWHLPLYLAPGPSAMPFSLFLALTVGQSLVYTALYLRSNGSLLPAVLLHATTDFGARLYHIDRFGRTTWMLIDLLVASVGIALLRCWASSSESANAT